MRSEYDVLDDGAIEDAVESGVVYETYCSRWLMLVLFCGLTFTNAFVWITFASIEVYTAEYFDVSEVEEDHFSLKGISNWLKKLQNGKGTALASGHVNSRR